MKNCTCRPGDTEETVIPPASSARTPNVNSKAPWEMIFVGYGDWHLWRRDGFRTRSAQLCRFLARSDCWAKVCVVNDSVTLRYIRKGFAIPRLERFRALPFRGGLRRAEEKIFLLDPSRLLVGPHRIKRLYTLQLVRKYVERLQALPILWIANVHKAYLMEGVPASLRIFDAIDDWESVGAFKPFAQRIQSGYETVIERADIIFTVSSYLKEKFEKRAKRARVIHLPNGVDSDLFCSPVDPPSVRRNAGRQSPRVLTYVGVLSERVDLDLIQRIAVDWPQCRIWLVGPISRDAERRRRELRHLANIEWKGLVHHSEIPSILRSSDVLLIPHQKSSLTLSMDPIKLYEYLTTGLPIVSTPVPPTDQYGSLLYLGEGKRFSEHIGTALEEMYLPEADRLWQARIQESNRHGWESRVLRIEKEIQERIKAGATRP